jgi:hypothetical protein
MNAPEGPAAPASGFTDDIATFEDLAADPEIAALLDFEPVPRKREVEGAWTPELQREFIVRLAVHGSPGRAAEEMGKTETGVRKLYRSPEAASFRAAWHGAVELAKRRKVKRRGTEEAVMPGSRPPSLDNRRKQPRGDEAGPLPGQVMNELGEWEDEDSYLQRAEESKDSIASKLLRCRRLFLQEISGCAGKRAAFEILTELPIDWEKAERLEPQADEPWRKTNAHQPDMILTAESGWSFGEGGYGPDKKAELRQAIDEHRAEEGLEPVEWEE